MKLIRTLLIFVLLIAVIYAVYDASVNQKPVVQYANCKGDIGIEVKNCAPNFKLKTLDGKKVELYQTNGKPTIINFWASWCDPCKKEMPFLEAAYKEHKDQINFRMVNETSQDTIPNIKKFMKQYKYTYPVILDQENEDGQTIGTDHYQLLGVPTTFVIDSTGMITHKVVGEMSKEELQDILDEVLS
ncbi:TlpA family protein disulfide reductase [Shimazuella sp. AN120528]|uniref:TlpA family protein disulfide reductase n=1 Tax=Shimazuella soli TaxID=1892854 RepID=UPI001F10138F|nr:TlpA disulfide reductase family protein [Shimazuella soli]MCH5584019.1 TlpA family protein disulfide reductase [Shimazuella soli]